MATIVAFKKGDLSFVIISIKKKRVTIAYSVP